MAKDATSFIRERKRNTRSIDEQVQIARAMWEQNVDQDHDGLKRKEIEGELGLTLRYKPRTSLHHLEEIGIVEEFVRRPETLVIAEWMDDGEGEIVLGRVEEAAQEGLTALADHVESEEPTDKTVAVADGAGSTLQSVIASEMDLIPEEVENYLRSTTEPVEVLNRAVEAIEEDDNLTVGADYGKIVFINTPYRYRLTEMAASLCES